MHFTAPSQLWALLTQIRHDFLYRTISWTIVSSVGTRSGSGVHGRDYHLAS